MNSLKNSIVAILLLGVSYGVYQVITTPEVPTSATAEFHAMQAPQIELAGESPAVGSPKSLNAQTGTAAPPAAPGPSARIVTNPSPPNKKFDAANEAVSRGEDNRVKGTSGESLPPLMGKPASPKDVMPQIDLPKTEFNAGERMIPAQPEDRNLIARTTAIATLPSLETALQSAKELIEAGQMRQALAELSPHANNWKLQPTERERLNSWLDSLAGKVIYSSEHHVDPLPYVVLNTDTLATIAEKWKVPQQLVFNINREQISDPFQLIPGTKLKKVEGPFRAELDQTNQGLTLYLGELYAGRFRTVENTSAMKPGTYQVKEKTETGHAQGRYCLCTDNPGVCLHAQPAESTGAGWSFSEADARDLFSILTVGSEIKVIR